MTATLFPDLKPHHVGLSVDNLEESIAFWSEYFGFELEFRKHLEPIRTHLAFLRRGDFRMELFEKKGSAPAPQERLNPIRTSIRRAPNMCVFLSMMFKACSKRFTKKAFPSPVSCAI